MAQPKSPPPNLELRIGTRVAHRSTGDLGIVTGRASRDPMMIKVLWVSNLYHGWIEAFLVTPAKGYTFFSLE